MAYEMSKFAELYPFDPSKTSFFLGYIRCSAYEHEECNNFADYLVVSTKDNVIYGSGGYICYYCEDCVLDPTPTPDWPYPPAWLTVAELHV